MKRVILIALFAASIYGGNVSASEEEKVSRQARETFKREFPSATFAKWEEIDNSLVYLVRFVYDNQGFVAYFNEIGAMIASARLVQVGSLPFKVGKTIREKYNDNEIIKIEELTMDGISSYFFTLENEQAKSVIRVYFDGTAQKIQEQKKRSSNNR
jgi:hypothetical protein